MAVAAIREKSWYETLVAPREWCDEQWERLFSPIDPEECAFFEAVIRAGKVFLLIIPTIAAYVLAGGVWVFEPASKPLEVEEAPLPLQKEIAYLGPNQVAKLPQELIGWVATFLDLSDKASLICTAKQFRCLTQGRASEVAFRREFRPIKSQIRGIDRSWVDPIPRSYHLAQFPPAYAQLAGWHVTRQNGSRFMEYLSRLIYGGPGRLFEAPKLPPLLIKQLGAEHITASLMCREGHRLAIRFRVNNSPNLAHLIFDFGHRLNIVAGNYQLFPRIEASLPEPQDNYFLRLINGEPLGQVPPGWPTVIELA